MGHLLNQWANISSILACLEELLPRIRFYSGGVMVDVGVVVEVVVVVVVCWCWWW